MQGVSFNAIAKIRAGEKEIQIPGRGRGAGEVGRRERWVRSSHTTRTGPFEGVPAGGEEEPRLSSVSSRDDLVILH